MGGGDDIAVHKLWDIQATSRLSDNLLQQLQQFPGFLKFPTSERRNETIGVGIHFTVHTKSAVAQMDVQTYFDKLPMSPDGLR